MPELAEVYYYSTQWNVGIGKPVRRVHVNPQARVYRGCDASELADNLIGARLKHTSTHGKQMLFAFSGGHWLTVHLGMTGELSAKPEPYEPGKHDHLVLHLSHSALIFTDPRKFGRIDYHRGPESPAAWKELPAHPLSDDFTVALVADALKRHGRTPLKTLLLDQAYFPGIGNWMADELMWQMKLRPQTPAGSLDTKQTRALWRLIRKICEVSLKTIGVDWSDPPAHWLFKYRWDKGHGCPRCGTALVRESVRGRTACWCPACQK
jgi:formamidopyrimidine-DNA glycosylase